MAGVQGLFDGAFEEIERIAEQGLGSFLEDTQHDANKRLMRKLRENYDTMSLEQVTQLWDQTGHDAGESPPCDTCKVIAKKEFELAEE